jgi:outer membrane protein OmpA-like peptidoglycan-associated protein
VEKIVEKPVEKKIVETKKAEPLRRDIFFTIKSTQITSNEMVKVGEIAEYLNQNPDAKVAITGYADKGTGNATINQNLSAKRADIVAKTLKTKYGIAANRISTDCKGDKEQPFAVNEQNRVSICIAK